MFAVFGKLNMTAFIVAFAVGVLAAYLLAPAPDVVVKFPTPWNAGKVIYSDKSDNCYAFKADAYACPADKSLIKPQPILEDFAKIKTTLPRS